MKRSISQYLRGHINRWIRKTFHKDWDVFSHGQNYFQEFADIYGNTINDIHIAEKFFVDVMEQTKGWVNVDFLDADYWDCIREIKIDKQNGLIWFYWQLPSNDPMEEMTKRMIFPFGYYGMCIKFDNVRFVKGKRKKCFGFVVNGFTIREKDIKGFAKSGGWNIKFIDQKSSFFSTGVVREKDDVLQHWRFIKTPISSFWIISKGLNVHSQDSEKLLYMYGVEKCRKELNDALEKIKHIDKLSVEEQRHKIKSEAHAMRTNAESLFKLIMCFHHIKYQFKVGDYDTPTLGDLIAPLKKNIYTTDFDRERIGEIPRIANDLSHDSGNPVNFNDLVVLYTDILYFINNFKLNLKRNRRAISSTNNSKPSPHDFVKEQYKNFCFIDEITNTVRSSTGKISFIIETQIGDFIDFMSNDGCEVLCNDGFIRNSKETGIDILKVWDRSEVIALLEAMYKKVIAECETKGYDTDIFTLGISFEANLKKEDKPCHLFTENEIEVIMRAADDMKNNKLVIDEDGYAHIIQETNQGVLYPVSIETWCAGNKYVGLDSSLSDLHDSYVLCMHLWLDYLESGKQMYDDFYMPDDGLEEVKIKVRKFY